VARLTVESAPAGEIPAAKIGKRLPHRLYMCLLRLDRRPSAQADQAPEECAVQLNAMCPITVFAHNERIAERAWSGAVDCTIRQSPSLGSGKADPTRRSHAALRISASLG
jgi:hypothetical protein